MKKKLIVSISSMMAVFLFVSTVASASISTIIPVTGSEHREIGPSFTTSATVLRSDLVDFMEDIQDLERDQDIASSFQFGVASTLVLHPVTRIGISIPSGGASGVLSTLVINNDLGSRDIQSALNSSTASSFEVTIEYERGNRGQDYWYAPSAVSVSPS
ncbi:hypothetical protein [Geomicrobium sp. JCM 19037]|uniref:hypothetical protein n=1 Tax=Geomicrobium sp. JCM 19037 TaxID=1460634 RepID=UPI0005A6F885|nr:hypothetical protein [Geomicrobium sp. JCM 19037]